LSITFNDLLNSGPPLPVRQGVMPLAWETEVVDPDLGNEYPDSEGGNSLTEGGYLTELRLGGEYFDTPQSPGS
jgi:hypothetical protein